MNPDQCPICQRELIDGPSVDRHHLIPKSLGGKDMILLHKVCHQKIHSVFTERELLKTYNTIPMILSHAAIQNFIKWVKKKPATFIDISVQSKRKKY